MWVHIPTHTSEIHTTSGDVALPAAPETFRFPLIFRLFFVFSIVFFLAFFFACLFWPGQKEPLPIAVPLLFLGFALLEGVALWFGLHWVAIDPKGIRARWPGFVERSLEWGQVHEVREKASWGILELHGPPGEPKVRLSYLLADFPRLREIIIKATGPAIAGVTDAGTQQVVLPATFRVSAGGMAAFFVIICLGCIALGAVCAMDKDWWAISIPVLAVGLGCTVILARWWYSLTVDADRLVLKALVRTREIPLAVILGAEITTVKVVQAGVTTDVRHVLLIILADGKHLKLAGLTEALKARHVIQAVKQRLASGS